MAIFYGNDDERRGGPVNIHRMNATKAYLRHYDNALTLKFIAQRSKDGRERREANAEIAIAERKMQFRQRQDNFDMTAAMKGIAELKVRWDR